MGALFQKQTQWEEQRSRETKASVRRCVAKSVTLRVLSPPGELRDPMENSDLRAPGRCLHRSYITHCGGRAGALKHLPLGNSGWPCSFLYLFLLNISP